MEKRMFRESVEKRRLVVPASGFYEWNENKDKYFFKAQDGKIMLFAGFHDNERFVILTTAANETVQDVHKRMPLILEKEEIEEWVFDEKATRHFLRKKPKGLDKQIVGQMSLF
jgi:putative SOS response-associated peptidase YedK